jgi:transcription factor Pcc1
MSRPKNCVARVQLFFGKKGTELKRKGSSKSPKFVSWQSKSISHSTALGDNKSSHNRIAQSVSVALKPPQTFSSSSNCPSSSSPFLSSLGANPLNLDANTKVSYDDMSNVYIEIETDDIQSLRACLNSYLRLADVSYRCIAEGNLE